jgi:predicted RNase H-like HicB family nuclease
MEQQQETPQIYCGKTIEEIRAMRPQHGHLFIVDVQDEDNVFHAICKEPTLQVMEAAQSISKASEAKGAMSLYTNCMVEADEDIKKRDVLKLQVAAAIAEKSAALKSVAKNV